LDIYGGLMRKLVFILVILSAIAFLAFQAEAVMFISGTSGGAAAGTWETVYDPTMTANNSWGTGTNFRNVITDALSSAGGPWTKVRVTYIAQTASATASMTASTCLRSGSTDDCTATPISMTVGSASSWTISAGGTALSDEATLSFTTTDDILIIIYTPGGEERYLTTSWPEGQYYLDNNVDETGLTTVSGYTGVEQYISNIDLVEGWNPD